MECQDVFSKFLHQCSSQHQLKIELICFAPVHYGKAGKEGRITKVVGLINKTAKKNGWPNYGKILIPPAYR